ncbi:type II toxin-antitoxin system RelE/ParE family toxin [Sphingomonas sp. RS2018]
MSTIVRSPEARDDAVDVWLYVAIHDVVAADRLLERFNRRIESLAALPLTGQARDKLGVDLRSVVVGRYVIFYRPLPDGVAIVCILHASRDIGPEAFQS